MRTLCGLIRLINVHLFLPHATGKSITCNAINANLGFIDELNRRRRKSWKQKQQQKEESARKCGDIQLPVRKAFRPSYVCKAAVDSEYMQPSSKTLKRRKRPSLNTKKMQTRLRV